MFKTGSSAYVFDAFSKIEILAETRASVFAVNEDGELTQLLASTLNGRMIVRTKEKPVNVFVSVPGNEHWSLESIPLASPFEKVNDIPVEIPEDKKRPETLQDKLKRFIMEQVADQYGQGSREMETLEEAMDFDIDGEDNILSGYELQDMDDVQYVPDETPDSVPAEQTPEETQSAATDDTAQDSPV